MERYLIARPQGVGGKTLARARRRHGGGATNLFRTLALILLKIRDPRPNDLAINCRPRTGGPALRRGYFMLDFRFMTLTIHGFSLRSCLPLGYR